VSTINDAVSSGAEGVAVHVNISADSEQMMLKNLGYVRTESESVGLPLLALMYARGNNDENYESLAKSDPGAYLDFVAHSVRVGVEMGANIIKTQYFADPTAFSTIASAAGDIPVLVSGGPTNEDEDAVILRAQELVSNGAYGVCFGRNIYHRNDPGSFITRLRKALSIP
jgi:DhnA family fructose-bisphosphate aldolase class Ia